MTFEKVFLKKSPSVDFSRYQSINSFKGIHMQSFLEMG
jgi:hypothetical protein